MSQYCRNRTQHAPSKKVSETNRHGKCWHISIAMKKNNITVLSPFEIRTLNHMAAPRASHTRPDKKCLHICVPGSGTAKICCTFGRQTVTCEETHARNADKTQKNGTYLQNGVNRQKCPRAAVFAARNWFGCSTHE